MWLLQGHPGQDGGDVEPEDQQPAPLTPGTPQTSRAHPGLPAEGGVGKAAHEPHHPLPAPGHLQPPAQPPP